MTRRNLVLEFTWIRQLSLKVGKQTKLLGHCLVRNLCFSLPLASLLFLLTYLLSERERTQDNQKTDI